MPMVIRCPRAAVRLVLLVGLLGVLAGAQARTLPTALAGTPLPDLTVQITERTQDPTVVNSTFKWDILVGNAGPGGATGVKLVIDLPTGFTSASANPATGSGFSCTLSGPATERVVTCQNGSVSAGATRKVSVEATTPAQTTFDSQLFSVGATVDPDQTVAEQNEANNSAAADMRVERRPDLDPDLSDVPLEVTEGQGLTYPIIVRNAGNRTATGVVVRASLPDEVSFVRAERGDFAVCNRAGREVTCTGGTIPAGSAGIFRIVITVPALGGNDSLLFSVEVDPNDAIRERNETNNTAFVLTEVGARPDLTVTATSTPWFMAAPFGAIRLPTHGTTVRVTVRNTGSSASPATTVRFNLRSPLADADIKCVSGMGIVDGSCVEFPPAGCNQSGVVVTCTVGSLAPGASATLLAGAFHDYIGFGYDFNTSVMVDPSNQVAEREEDNNTVTLNVRVG